MTAHKWADEIKAWADGKAIEQRHPGSEYKDYIVWHAFDGQWGKHQGWEYRVKSEPVPKPDNVKGFVFRGSGSGLTPCLPNDADFCVVRDGETGRAKSVRMISKPDPIRMEALLRKMAEEDFGFDTLAEIKDALRLD